MNVMNKSFSVLDNLLAWQIVEQAGFTFEAEKIKVDLEIL